MLLCWRPQPTGSQTRTQKPLTAKIANRQPSIHTNPTHPPIHPPATSTIFHSTANCVYHTHAFVHVNQPPTSTASLPHRGPVFFFSHPTCAGHIYIDRDKGFLSNEYRQYQIDQSNLSSLVDFPNTTLLTSRNRIVIGKIPTLLLDDDKGASLARRRVATSFIPLHLVHAMQMHRPSPPAFPHDAFTTSYAPAYIILHRQRSYLHHSCYTKATLPSRFHKLLYLIFTKWFQIPHSLMVGCLHVCHSLSVCDI
ncbi:hypothetical protein M408DRAFT_160580 [Serendipita vermifera MAFF 305830]|uniref:Uncharacterized protein n=1 Tax=Serendipita vermifera MAFF 305830 TaxID=933852 RepID=A0A0C3B8U0_SERVB|nr:hypothetical protein M408DRAFT_160580 [Serendipita vermifera MAFF 305830]